MDETHFRQTDVKAKLILLDLIIALRLTNKKILIKQTNKSGDEDAGISQRPERQSVRRRWTEGS